MSRNNRTISTSEQDCQSFLTLFLSEILIDQKKGYIGLYKIINRYVNYRFQSHDEDFRQDVIQIALTKIDKAGRNSSEPIHYCGAWIRTIVERVGIGEYRKKEKVEKSTHLNEEKSITITPKPSLIWLEDDEIAECIDHVLMMIEQNATGPDDLTIIAGLVLGDAYKDIAMKIGRSESAVSTRVSILRKQMNTIREDIC